MPEINLLFYRIFVFEGKNNKEGEKGCSNDEDY